MATTMTVGNSGQGSARSGEKRSDGMPPPKRYIIAAGGTGGHLFPAQAVAKGLLEKGYRVSLITDPRFAAYTKGFEGVEIHTLPTSKVSGGVKAKIMAVLGIIKSLFFARRLLKELHPAAVIGFGGYPSFPTMQAAIWLKIPTLIHEQNKLMGRANRMLAGGVTKIATSFPDTLLSAKRSLPTEQGSARSGGVWGKEPHSNNITLTGNPVRPAILELHGTPYTLPATDKKWNLLIFGGSQGAKIFSTIVPEAMALLPEDLRNRLSIVQQARQEDLVTLVQRYSDLRIIAEVKTFFDDMPERLAKAHLLICRSGASTIAELTVAGRPAIYAPYPYAADDHQSHNAAFVMQHEAGWLMPDAKMTAESLPTLLTEILQNPEKLEKAATNARSLALPDAAAKIIALAETL